MNKKLLTLAVAAAMVAPTAAMAEAILYGKLHVSVDWADVDSVRVATGARLDRADVNVPGGDTNDNRANYKGWGVNGGGYIPGEGRASRIGVKGSEDLGNGLKAIYQVEFGVSLSEESKAGTGAAAATGNVASGADDTVTMRNSFVGLAGGWGTFVVGRNDTPMKTSTGKLDLFSDTMADYNGTVGFQDIRADNAIAYISPNMSGFQLAAATVAGGGSTATVQGDNLFSDTLAEAYSIAGIYSNGPFYGSLAYESIGEEMRMNTDVSLACSFAGGPACADEANKWRLGLGLMDWNGFTLTGIYEKQEVASFDTDLWQVQAGYAFGNNMVKAMYGQQDNDADYERDSWALAFDHNFSKRTKAYVLYTQTDDNVSAFTSGDWEGLSIGMIHDF